MSRMRWNPVTGDSETFEDGQAVPEGYLDHHPDDPAYKDAPEAPARREPAKPKAAAATLPVDDGLESEGALTRAEIIDALKEGGITVNPTGKRTDALDAILVEALQKALVTAKKDFPAGANSKALLALVKGETPNDDGGGTR